MTNKTKKVKPWVWIVAIALILIIAIILIIKTDKNIPYEVEQTPKSVYFFYSLSCPHCQKVMPLIEEYSNKYTDWNWEFHNVVEEQIYMSVPLVLIKTSDGRNITLVGSEEIPKWLKCELEEQSSVECPTYTGKYNPQTQSWFIR